MLSEKIMLSKKTPTDIPEEYWDWISAMSSYQNLPRKTKHRYRTATR